MSPLAFADKFELLPCGAIKGYVQNLIRHFDSILSGTVGNVHCYIRSE